MLYIKKIDDYFKFFTDETVKDFVAINCSDYFKSIREVQNLRKFAKSLYIFREIPNEVEKHVQSNIWKQITRIDKWEKKNLRFKRS